jgi:hypothetical protein
MTHSLNPTFFEFINDQQLEQLIHVADKVEKNCLVQYLGSPISRFACKFSCPRSGQSQKTPWTTGSAG